MKPSVYLAGPIAGLTIEEARAWRYHAILKLDEHGIRGIDPLAGAQSLDRNAVQSKQAPELDPFTSAKGIMCQDFYYCTHADMVICNFLGATKVSIGSVMECAWAYQCRTPLVIVGASCQASSISDTSQLVCVHDHTMLRSAADYWVDDVETALDICVKVLGQ